MNLKKIGKIFTSKFVGTGPSSYEKKNLQGRGLTKVEKHCSTFPAVDINAKFETLTVILLRFLY